VGYADFARFTPRGDRLLPLCQFARTYAGPDLDFDVQVVLKKEEIPACRLGGDGADGSHLGWNTWLFSLPFAADAEDAVFENEGAPTA
jgi:type VI secretion system protein ImpH